MFLHIYICIVLAGLQININAAQEGQGGNSAEDNSQLSGYGKTPAKAKRKERVASRNPYPRPTPTQSQQTEAIKSLHGCIVSQTITFNTNLAEIGSRLSASEAANAQKEKDHNEAIESLNKKIADQKAEIEALKEHFQPKNPNYLLAIKDPTYLLAILASQQQQFLNEYIAMTEHVKQCLATQQATSSSSTVPRQQTLLAHHTTPTPLSMPPLSPESVALPAYLQPTS